MLTPQELIASNQFVVIVSCWKRWANVEAVKPLVVSLIDRPESLAKLLERFLSIGRAWSDGDSVTRKTYQLDPTPLIEYVDLPTLDAKVAALHGVSFLTDVQKIAIKQFEKSAARIRQGFAPAEHDEDE
jgi:hypothetical protein